MTRTVPSVSVSYARTGGSTKSNALGMRPMRERAYENIYDPKSASLKQTSLG